MPQQHQHRHHSGDAHTELHTEQEERSVPSYQPPHKRRNLGPEAVAQCIARGVARHQAIVAVGIEAHLSLWQSRLLPWLTRRIARLDLVQLSLTQTGRSGSD